MRLLMMMMWLWAQCPQHLFAQHFRSDTVAVWQGFEHHWTYNHRLNRMGNYLLSTDEGYEVVHSAATGTGPDIGTFTARYAKLHVDGLHHLTDTAVLLLPGREKRYINSERWITVSVPDHLRGHGFDVVLNGFEALSRKKAEKPNMLRMGVDSIARDGDRLRFRVSVEAIFNCNSLECPWLSNKVDYEFVIGYLVLAHSGLESASDLESAQVHWSRQRRGRIPEAVSLRHAGYGNDLNFTAFRSISIELNRAHYFISIGWSLLPDQKAKFLFAQYAPGMKRGSAYPGFSRFSVYRRGYATFRTRLAHIGFGAAVPLVEYRSVSSATGKWRGRNTSSVTEDAVQRLQLEF